MGHIRSDYDNPTCREWCVLALRHLCEESEKIREEIKKVKTMDMSEEGKMLMKKLGLGRGSFIDK